MKTIERITFLLGAGISIPAGMPPTNDITEQILSGDGVAYNSDGTYYPNGGNNADPYYIAPIRLITRFLTKIKEEINSYYSKDQNCQTNYEELFYFCSQVYDSETGEYENLALKPFTEKLIEFYNQVIQNPFDEINREWDFHRLLGESLNYISDVVWRLLIHSPTRINHLDCIVDVYKDSNIKKLDIFTLNHDTVIEQVLLSKGISLNLGFSKPLEGVRYWNTSILEEESCKIRLIKLHGSINWFRFQSNSIAQGIEAIGIPANWDIWHVKTPTGELQHALGGRPEFLAGTFNKILQYSTGIYADLHSLFRKLLRKSELLVISGYSFHDKGINSQIVEWMYLSPKNRILVIHQKPNDLINQSRGAINRNWAKWREENRISVINKWIEDITWQEIKSIAF
jgi:hypothetical protein